VPYSICWSRHGERWPLHHPFKHERHARLLAEALRYSVAGDFQIETETGRVVERFEPIWDDEHCPPSSSTKNSGDAFWRSHPEIVSSDHATELYFTSSIAPVSVLAKHWLSAETMWTSILLQSEYGGGREASIESLLSSIPPETNCAHCWPDADEDWSLPLPPESPFGIRTFALG